MGEPTTVGQVLEVLGSYRVGLGADLLTLRTAWRRRDGRSVRYTLRRMLRSCRHRWWWGLWQAELDGSGLNAQRGLTEDGARWRMYLAWQRARAGRGVMVLPAKEGGDGG